MENTTILEQEDQTVITYHVIYGSENEGIGKAIANQIQKEKVITNQNCRKTIEGVRLTQALDLKLGYMFYNIGISFYNDPCEHGFNFIKARKFYELSSKFNDPHGMYSLADMHHKGVGGLQDSEKALSLLGDLYLCNSETDLGSKALRYMSKILGSGDALEVVDKSNNDKILRFRIDGASPFVYSGDYEKKCQKDFHDPCKALEILNECNMLLSDEYLEMYQKHACEVGIVQNYLDELHAW